MSEDLYLPIFATLDDAKNRSHAIAVEKGCAPEDVTKFWFGFLEHPISSAGALTIPDGYAGDLTPEEQAELIDGDAMIAAGWDLNWVES